MLIADQWKNYELIDTGHGERLERWGEYILRRPDPQIIWPASLDSRRWEQVDGHYHRSRQGGGNWDFKRQLPERWTLNYKNLSFNIRPTDFKHTGLFPEQAVNWDWMIETIQNAGRPIRVLNLFAYTGGATVAAAYAGAEVCHLDAAKGMVAWAKNNLSLSGLGNRPVRFLVDDALKFVQREKRRERTYDAIIMDPPSYGRGPNGEIWKIEERLFEFVEACQAILSENPLFFLINSYTALLSPQVVANILSLTVGKRYGGQVSCGEVGLPVTSSKIVLPCGVYGRWEEKG